MTPPRPAPWPLAQGLQSAREALRSLPSHDGRSRLLSVTVRLPWTDPLALFRAAVGEERAFWEQPGNGFSLAAVGVAAVLDGHGEGRFAQVAAAWEGLRQEALVEGDTTAPLTPPVCLGGFAFASGGMRALHWRPYGDGRLVVPRLLLVAQKRESWLTLTVPSAGGGGLPLFSRPESLPDDEGERLDITIEGLSGEDWQRAVAVIVQETRRGVVDKVVLAREVRARASRPFPWATVLERLRRAYRGCTVFAFARGDSCFLGATPERLARLEGRRLRADCLAGSAPRGETLREDERMAARLLADPKERREHVLVVEAVRQALLPLCQELWAPPAPQVLRTPHVQHLHTPIEGRLREGTGLLEVVARLHPTPAVGGAPQKAALALIDACETFDRGWYAGPVGWLDGSGDGEFVVAIRSALLRGREAHLYAGCGILPDSDPRREEQESLLKLKAMLTALGGEG